MKTTIRAKQGFTLIEIMIVVFIIGVLAAIAIPAIQKQVRNARAASFVSDIRTLSNAAQQYALESGWWVPDYASGAFPAELDGYFSRRKFELGTTLGGVWDFEQDDVGDFTSAVGVVNAAYGDEVFIQVDKVLDDGNLNTGLFVKTSENTYYYVIEE